MTDHTARRVVMPSPDLLYATCRMDLSQGPLRIQADPKTPRYWSIALYASNSDNFFVLNDRQANGQPVDLWLVGPHSPVATDTGPAGARRVQARINVASVGGNPMRAFMTRDEDYFVPLGNSLSLSHLANPKVDFPRVKMLSAVGWIAGLFGVGSFASAESPTQFYIAGAASVAFGLFALALPHTPPKKTGANVTMAEILGFDALALLKKPSFAIFIVCMFLICIPLYFYFVNLGVYLTQLKWSSMLEKTSLAQVSDVIFFLLLPFFLGRFGYKLTIFMGIACWVLRYFALGFSADGGAAQTALIFGAILLHGCCYDFLFIAGQLYVDEEANERMRGAAQGLIAFILWGIGGFVGSYLGGAVTAAHKLPVAVGSIEHDWKAIWLTPAWGALAVLVVFLIFFRNPAKGNAANPPA